MSKQFFVAVPQDGEWTVDKIAHGIQNVSNEDAGYTVLADSKEAAMAELQRLDAVDAFVVKPDLTKVTYISVTVEEA